MMDKMDMAMEHQEKIDGKLKRLSWKFTERLGQRGRT